MSKRILFSETKYFTLPDDADKYFSMDLKDLQAGMNYHFNKGIEYERENNPILQAFRSAPEETVDEALKLLGLDNYEEGPAS